MSNSIVLLESAIQKLSLPEANKEFIQFRLISILKEYRIRVQRYSVSFNTMRVTITVGSLIVPALLSVQYTQNHQQEVYWIVWVLSLLVTISNGILTLLKVDKKYYTLHTTYQHLLSESWQYIHLSGSYSGFYTPTQQVSHQNQYIFFCNRIEKIRMRHIEDEYYKVIEQGTQQKEAIVPPTPLPFQQEKSDSQVNGGLGLGTTIRKNQAPLTSIREEGADHESA